MTQIVWPRGCVCHAVRAPGVKWTAAAPSASLGPRAIVSMKTVPLNHSAGPRSGLDAVPCDLHSVLLSFRPPANPHQKFLGTRHGIRRSRAGFALRSNFLSIACALRVGRKTGERGERELRLIES